MVLRTAICPAIFDKNFQVYVMPAVQAMDTPEFFCFGVKITNSRIKVYTRRTHILSIQSKVCFQDNAMHPTFF